jgi:hypothetical protein
MTTSSDRNSRDIVTLRDYLESQIAALKDTMSATDRRVDDRLVYMNELRDQITSERGWYMLRSEHELIHKSLDADIRVLRESKAELHGKASISAVYIAGILASMSLLIGVASIVMDLVK